MILIRTSILILLFISIRLGTSANMILAEESVAQAVVRITSYRQSPDWANPWRMKPTRADHGSGFLILNKYS